MTLTGNARADFVVNGNFATGDFTGWTFTGDPSGAYVSGVPDAFSAALTTSSDDLFLSQDLALVAGQKYSVSFDLGGDGATPNRLLAKLGGSTLLNINDIPLSLSPFTSYTFDFTASTSLNSLVFQVADTPGYLYLTNVAVVTSVVPEPSAIISLGTGAVLLAGCLLRRCRTPAELLSQTSGC